MTVVMEYGVEGQVAKLESDVAHLRSDVKEMKHDIRELRSSVVDIQKSIVDLRHELRHSITKAALSSRIWMLLLIGATLGVMAHGFKWL